MTDIRVGQIWEHKKGKIMVVSCLNLGQSTYTCIFDTGYAKDSYYADIVYNYKPIATYPTWQEAVNSKEFNQ